MFKKVSNQDDVASSDINILSCDAALNDPFPYFGA